MTQMNNAMHKPLDLSRNREAFLRRAFAEPDGCLSVGGLGCGTEEKKPAPDGNRLMLARLVELARRKQRLTVEDLAKRADVDLVDLIAIENGSAAEPEPRTLHRLASFLQIKVENLVKLAGAMAGEESRISEAALRFAARSESMAKLTAEEERALNEFVQELAK